MNLAEFIKATYPVRRNSNRPYIVCVDGFTMSVQASHFHYCTPRIDTDSYSHLEIGYPSQEESELMPYCEDNSKPTDTVYGWVPAEIIQAVIDKHGGIDEEKTFAITPKQQTTF